MKTKFIYVIMAVLLMGSQMTLSAQNTDNKQKKQRPTPVSYTHLTLPTN